MNNVCRSTYYEQNKVINSIHWQEINCNFQPNETYIQLNVLTKEFWNNFWHVYVTLVSYVNDKSSNFKFACQRLTIWLTLNEIIGEALIHNCVKLLTDLDVSSTYL